jgi:diacylglycerol kinase family enzyme
MAGFLLVNPHAGRPWTTADELVAEAGRREIVTHVLREGDDPADLARRADAAALGIAGGDGSLAAVAAVAIERDVPFVCVPFGTRNHFARDLGLDRSDPIGGLDAFAGRERRVDVGRVNGRIFLNNVSLGAYAKLVHRRERHRRRREAWARVRAWLTVLTHRRLAVTIDGVPTQAQLVLVGNNVYVLELPTLGARDRLDEGVLSLYALDGTVDERRGERFVLDASVKRLDAAIDGEPAVLTTPVEFRVEPRALRLLVPPGLEDVRDQGIEGELGRRRELAGREPAQLGDVVVGDRLTTRERADPEEVQGRSSAVAAHPDPEESPDVE